MLNLDTFVHGHIDIGICQHVCCFLFDDTELHPEYIWLQPDSLQRACLFSHTCYMKLRVQGVEDPRVQGVKNQDPGFWKSEELKDNHKLYALSRL